MLGSLTPSSTMDVVEAPEMRIRDVLPGAILLFSLDPVASVADMDDEEATAAAARLQPGRALVMVRRRKIDRLKPLHTQPLAFHLFSIGHGLPHPPYACVGLSAEAVHPHGRAPILPSIPLPWPDCYVHPFREFAATITRMHLSPTGPVSTVTREEHLAVLGYLFEDSAALIREREGDEPDDDDDGRSNNVADMDHGVPAPVAQALTDGEPEPSRDPPMLRLRGEIWLDLAAFEDFDPPEHMANLLEALAKIEDDWAKRKVLKLLADQPRTEQWANEVAAAEPAGDIESDKPIEPTSPAEDDILPEDAIDDRIARAAASRAADGGVAPSRVSKRVREKVPSVHTAPSPPLDDHARVLHISTFGAVTDAQLRPPSRDGDRVPTAPISTIVGETSVATAHVASSPADDHTPAVPHIATVGIPAVRAASVHEVPPHPEETSTVGEPAASEAPVRASLTAVGEQAPAAPYTPSVEVPAPHEPIPTVDHTRVGTPPISNGNPPPDVSEVTPVVAEKKGHGRLWPILHSRLKRIWKAVVKPLKNVADRLRARTGTKP
ncbi:hypothetical protein AURDEDRAFT_185687 [Auricularia subglabra TFB-10046 SS5]|nr:hypothetical protein AURDEDRAFT_185687 [Auricularia subglabra TFB-10046 SS5]